MLNRLIANMQQSVHDYSYQHFRRDLVAGIIVGFIAIPLAMAFAIASGVKPEYGLYTTIIAGILISLLGGSRFQVGGPTGAFVPILFGIVYAYGYENLLIAGFMAGCLLLLMGIFKFGSLINYIPRPVIIGFTSGIAVIIFTGQIENFLGLSGVDSHAHFLDNIKELASKLGTINLYSIFTALICLGIIILFKKYLPKIPGTLVGLAVSAIIATMLYPQEVATIGSTYGDIPQALPALQLPQITWETIRMLMIPALMIAMLGGIESLLSATVADGMTGDRHHSNKELVGQGIANMVTPLFGGIPATGAIARTAANIKSGAATRLSGVIHGIVVLLILLLFAPYTSHIPLASLAPILMVVAWNMSEQKRFIYLLKMKNGDSVIMVASFVATVLIDLSAGMGIGLVLGFAHFIRKMSRMKIDIIHHDRELRRKGIKHLELEGILFFGAARQFESTLQGLLADQPKYVLLNMNKVLYLDITGVSYFSEIVQYIKRYGGEVIIIGIQSQPLDVMVKSGLDYHTNLSFSHDLNNALMLIEQLSDPNAHYRHSQTNLREKVLL